MKDFGAWFNEQQPEPGAPQPEQACAAQGAAGCVINDPYLSAGALMGGCLAPGQLASYAAPTQRDMFAQRQEPQLLHRERAHVVLHGDALSPQMFDEDCTFDDVSRWLQRAVAQLAKESGEAMASALGAGDPALMLKEAREAEMAAKALVAALEHAGGQ